MLLAYFGGALIVLVLGMGIGRFVFRLNGTERVLMGMTGAFSNNGTLAIPLVPTSWGEPGLVPLLMIMALHSAVLLSLCMVLIEWRRGGENGTRTVQRLGVMLFTVLRHPLLIGILLGLTWGVAAREFGLAFPSADEPALKWIGDSAIPCGLIVLLSTALSVPVGAPGAADLARRQSGRRMPAIPACERCGGKGTRRNW